MNIQWRIKQMSKECPECEKKMKKHSKGFNVWFTCECGHVSETKQVMKVSPFDHLQHIRKKLPKGNASKKVMMC